VGEPTLWNRPIGALFSTRFVRAVADGLVAASLAAYLTAKGLRPWQIGAFVTATLIGSAVVVLLAGFKPQLLTPTRLVLASASLMIVLGIVFALRFPIFVLAGFAMIGPLNPSGGDVSAFLPAEQTLLTDAVAKRDRTTLFARFSLVAALGAALGGVLASLPQRLERRGWSHTQALSSIFWIYSAAGVITGSIYLFRVVRMKRDSDSTNDPTLQQPSRQEPLGPSRKTVRDLAILFSLDAAGGGFVVTSLLGLWLAKRFHFNLASIGGTLALMSLLSAASALAAPRLVRKYGPVRTMVFTHMPAQVFLLIAAIAPNAKVAVVCLALRSLTSSLDVPARTAFVMNVVSESERAAAASFTNIPRSLAAASTPIVAGWMLSSSASGWPLIAGAICKLTYDVLLYFRFRHLDAENRSFA
jgi:MFS family permease